jgi:hypothetical protein
MITQVICQHCGHNFEADVVDKTTECPACGQQTNISPPAPEQSPPADPQPQTPAARPHNYRFVILGSFILAGIVTAALIQLHFSRIFQQTKNAQELFSNKSDKFASKNLPNLVTWQYAAFQWQDDRFPRSAYDRERHDGQILVTIIKIPDDKSFQTLYADKGAQAVNIDHLLDIIGHYGWELVCFDGKNYIVKRPRDWQSGTFYLTDEWQDLPKTR